MTKQEMQAMIEAAMASGNAPEVKVIKEGERKINPAIRYCRCGCEGNWTDHTMRAGENGRYGLR